MTLPNVSEEIEQQIREVYRLDQLLEQESEKLLGMLAPLNRWTDDEIRELARYTTGLVRFHLIEEMNRRGMLAAEQAEGSAQQDRKEAL